ncbi:MAG: hypothetical protein HUJ76_04800 [Parasporobacterium sp.]|nr:hypothetical protein [Parasporobacterium sp.]
MKNRLFVLLITAALCFAFSLHALAGEDEYQTGTETIETASFTDYEAVSGVSNSDEDILSFDESEILSQNAAEYESGTGNDRCDTDTECEGEITTAEAEESGSEEIAETESLPDDETESFQGDETDSTADEVIEEPEADILAEEDSELYENEEATEESDLDAEASPDGFVYEDGAWKWYENGVFQSEMKGLVYGTIDGAAKWYYISNGIFAAVSGISRRADLSNNTWYYVQNGVYTKASGLARRADLSNNKWYYVQNGIYTKATGLSQRADGSNNTWYYVENGVYVKATTAAERIDGTYAGRKFYVLEGAYTKTDGFGLIDGDKWVLLDGGVLQETVTGLVKGDIDGVSGWYYTDKGYFTKVTGLTQKADKSGGWYYVKDGVYTKVSGIAQKADMSSTKWYYVQKGVYTKATGIAKKADGSSNKWYYVKDGKYVKATTAAERIDGVYEGVKFCVINGAHTKVSGFCQIDGNRWGWFSNGILEDSMTGIARGFIDDKEAWYYIENGFFTRATGLTRKADQSGSKWYYVKDGVYTKATGLVQKADLSSGKWYYIKDGIYTKVSGLAQRADLSSTNWYYVHNGAYTKASGLAQKADGSETTWYYVKNGIHAKATTAAIRIDEAYDGAKFYVENGIYSKVSGFRLIDGDRWGWFDRGMLKESMSGIVKGYIDDEYAWYYIANGIFTEASGLTRRADLANNKWYYVQDGVYTQATGLAQRADKSNNKWYYVKNGVYTKVTGLAQRIDKLSSTWFYVKDGIYTKEDAVAKKVDGSDINYIYYVKNGVYQNRTEPVQVEDFISILQSLGDGRFSYGTSWIEGGLSCSEYVRMSLALLGILSDEEMLDYQSLWAYYDYRNVLSDTSRFEEISADEEPQDGDIMWYAGAHVSVYYNGGLFEAAPEDTHFLSDNGETAVGYYPYHDFNCAGAPLTCYYRLKSGVVSTGNSYYMSLYLPSVDDDDDDDSSGSSGSSGSYGASWYYDIYGW